MSRFCPLKVVVTIPLLFFSSLLGAQNLVPNASFEEINACPQNATADKLSLPTGWTQPGEGTPDIFNTCSVFCHPLQNFAGQQAPQEGAGYAGFIAFSNQVKTYREYLQAPLGQRLQAGKTYQVAFYVSLADHSGYAVSNIGCGFHTGPLESETNFALRPAVVLESDTVVKNSNGWTCLRFNYTATGDETYFLVGNFRKFHEIKKIEQHRPGSGAVTNQDAYYYVDGINVHENHDASMPVTQAEKDVKAFFTNDSTMVLSNLEFAYDSYRLSSKDSLLLEQVSNYFRLHTGSCLRIEGHTDARGSYLYNKELSLKRARAVAAFLQRRNIQGNRLSPAGLGYSRPLDAKNPQSPANRRVEIRLRPCP